MPRFLRLIAPACLLLASHALAATSTNVPPAKPNPPKPVAPAPIPAPAFMDVVTFEYRENSETKKLAVISAPGRVRFDADTEGYSVIYDPQADHYTGLEHRNCTWWEYSWPEVRAAVENSQRAERRMQSLGSMGIMSDMSAPSPAATTNAPAVTTTSTTPDDDSAGYVWKPTKEMKEIAGIQCVKWTGETLGAEEVEAWCTTAPEPKIHAAIFALRVSNEPMSLVSVRPLVPDFIFPVFSTLAKGGVTPLFIRWGSRQDPHEFRFREQETKPGKLALFTVPKIYTKTTLVTMDGLIDSQPAPGQRKSDKTMKDWGNRPQPPPKVDPMTGQ